MDKAIPEAGSALAYYLGSKQRMAQTLANSVADVCAGGRVLDLFSGMGSASVALSKEFDVTAVDVQEYSRAMCSALLVGGFEDGWTIQEALSGYKDALKSLMRVYEPMIEYEARAVEEFRKGDGRPFSDIIEHGCLLPGYRGSAPKDLKRTMEQVEERRGGCVQYDVPIRYFGGLYFSYLQAIEITAIRSCIESAPKEAKDIMLAGLICAASHCASTVGGQFAQPLKTVDASGAVKSAALEKACRSRRESVHEHMRKALNDIEVSRVPRSGNEAACCECCTFVEQSGMQVAAIYADPPYSRYHYSRYYHVLETIALGDEPPITANPATGAPSRGVYRANRYQSPFSTRAGAIKGFERLIGACADMSPSLVLSYSPYPSAKASTPRMVTIDQLAEIAKRSFKSVEVREIAGIVHSKLANGRYSLPVSDYAEVLIICSR